MIPSLEILILVGDQIPVVVMLFNVTTVVLVDASLLLMTKLTGGVVVLIITLLPILVLNHNAFVANQEYVYVPSASPVFV